MVYEIKEHLHRLYRKGISEDDLQEFAQIWHDGVIRQLGNVPVDMRIERWLYESYPGLRPKQAPYLSQLMKKSLGVLAPRFKDLTPEKVYYATNVMNAAYARYLGHLLSSMKWFEAYAGTPFEHVGKDLGDQVWEMPDSGYRGDVETIEAWSHLLALDAWWQWGRA